MIGHRFSACLVIALTVLLAGCTMKRGVTLAEVNGKRITEEDFLSRYQKYLTATSERENIVVRKKILNNMVNELLIFDDAKRQGFDSDGIYRDKLEDITGQALLDGYAKKMSTDTMTVTEPELWNEFRMYNSMVNARFVYAKNKTEAWSLKRRLENGENFSTLANEVFDDPDLAKNGGDLGYFGWGEMEPALEEAAYTLPIGTLSDPIKMRVGYGIVKVEHRFEKPLASESDYSKVRSKLEQSVRQRKTVEYLKTLGDGIEKGLSPRFDEESVNLVLKNWSVLAGDAALAGSVEKSTSPELSRSSLRLVEFKNGSWTTGQFIAKLGKTREKHRRRVQDADDVKQVVVGLAIRDVMLDRARKEGLENDDRVQAQVKKLREDFLLKRWAESVQDTVGHSGLDEKTLREEFQRNVDSYATPSQANVAEILVRSEKEAAELAQEVKAGKDFAGLARSRSIRGWAAKNGGEIGFAPSVAFGNLAPLIFKARVGEVIGPLSVNPYFGLYKILAFKKSKPRTFQEARDDVAKSLLPRMKQQVFADAVGRLRAGAHVNMDIEALGNVVVSSQ